MSKVETSRLVASTRLDEMTSQVEAMYTKHFADGSRKKALQRLRSTGDNKTHHFATFRAGLFLGLSESGQLGSRRRKANHVP